MRLSAAAPVIAAAAAALLGGGVVRPYFRAAGELRPPKPAAAPHRKVRAVAFDARRRLLTVGSEGELKVWDPGGCRRLEAWRLTAPERPLLAAQFSGDGKKLAVVRIDGPLQVWDVDRRAIVRSFRSPDVERFGFSMLSFSRDGRRLAVAPAMGRLQVWDVGSGAEVFGLASDNAHWGTLALSPAGDRLARGGHTPLEVWDLAKGQRAPPAGISTIDPPAIGWTASGDVLLLAPNAGDALPDDLLLLSTRRLQRIPAGPPPPTGAVAGSPDGSAVASAVLAASRTEPLSVPQPAVVPQVWERATGAARFLRQGILPFRAHRRFLTAIAWRPDGTRLASGDLDGEVVVWDARTGEPLWRVR